MSKGNGTTAIAIEAIAIEETAPVEAEVEAVDQVDQEEAEAPAEAAQEPAAATEPQAAQETLSRYSSPSKAMREWLARQLAERIQTIEGGIWDDGGVSWNGVRVITAADFFGVFEQPVPEPSAFSSEARSGGVITVWTHCPNCGIANPLRVDVGAQLTITDEQERKLKPTFKVEARTHVCGQSVLPLRTDEQVEGQTEAFPDDIPDPAGEHAQATDELTAEAVGKLLDQVADILPDSAPLDLPDDDVIATWTDEQLLRVATWARAVIAGEGPYPEQPAEVTPTEPGDDEGADAEP